jgi:hypothetical protein
VTPHARPLAFVAAVVLLASVGGCGTCEPSPKPPPDAGTATFDGQPFPFASGRMRLPPAPKPVPLPCRAATVAERVSLAPLALGDAQAFIPDAGIPNMSEIPDDVWIDLDRTGRLVSRDPRSTREASFIGPARVRACVDRDEESWLLRGAFDAVPGAGERPGGEEWVVLPLGVVRYASAGMRITASAQSAEARMVKGTAYVWAAVGASVLVTTDAGAPRTAGDDGWVRIDEGAVARVKLDAGPAPAAEDAARTATDKCADAARAARSLADQISAMTGNLGDLAPKHVVARRLARAACGVARLRVNALAPSANRDGLLARTRDAETSWRTLGEPAQGPTQAVPSPTP